MRSKIALVAAVIILILINWSISGKEQHIKKGTVVFLQLGPVDPRSLMQGDYMALRFSLANEIYNNLPKIEGRRNISAINGRIVVALDENAVARFKRLQDDQPLATNELLIRYRIRNGVIKFATNAFFFQEGEGEVYQKSRYGQFRVDKEGELLLISMHDKEFNKLNSKKIKTKNR